jgi:hypothetical protein
MVMNSVDDDVARTIARYAGMTFLVLLAALFAYGFLGSLVF